ANSLIRTGDDLLILLQTAQYLEVFLAGNPSLYGPEGHFVVGPDDEHTLDILLADFLLRLRLAQADGRIARLQRLVLTNRERYDRNRQHVPARVGDDLRRGGEVGARLGRRIEQLNRDFIVYGLIAARLRRRAGLHRAVRDLRNAADECRVREGVDLDERRIADRDARHVRLVHLHLRFEDGHVADREQRRRVLVERSHNCRLAALDVEARHTARHRREDRRLSERTAHLRELGGVLIDEVVLRLEHRLIDVHRRAQLLELLVGDQLGIGFLDLERA